MKTAMRVSGGQDRAHVFTRAGALVAVVADGSGATAVGGAAADLVIEAVKKAPAGTDWAALLSEVDARLVREGSGAQTTAVILAIAGGRITGASVGDSGAWIIDGDSVTDLTAGQQRKPLLGSGHARPVAFTAESAEGRALLASDGLLKYAAQRFVAEAASGASLDGCADSLLALPRLRSGQLPDDVAVILIALA